LSDAVRTALKNIDLDVDLVTLLKLLDLAHQSQLYFLFLDNLLPESRQVDTKTLHLLIFRINMIVKLLKFFLFLRQKLIYNLKLAVNNGRVIDKRIIRALANLRCGNIHLLLEATNIELQLNGDMTVRRFVEVEIERDLLTILAYGRI